MLGLQEGETNGLGKNDNEGEVFRARSIRAQHYHAVGAPIGADPDIVFE
jgi:hypothetical protein